MDLKVIGTGVWATLITVWKIVDTFMTKYREIITAIVLRVQKDTADGTWTDEEKEQEVIDIYNNYVKPKLPWYVTLFISEDRIRKIIKDLCEKAANHKGQVSG